MTGVEPFDSGFFGDPDPALAGLDVYVVGGAVRDHLLGLPAGDRDWVVVGTTPDAMAKRGFIPVGGDFPVFLHPETKEEYALARTERKSGRGYKGFIFYTGTDVTLEQDLQRRDLTVNAMAVACDGSLVDPLDGLSDVQAKVLRHVGDAFTEDPVRLLRLARFAARFSDFSIAPETMALAKHLVEHGEVDALVPERVWREVAKGLEAERPGRMCDVLQQAGALERVLPGLVFNDDIDEQLACAVRHNLNLTSRFALLCRLSEPSDGPGRHVRAPGECIDYARLLPLVVDAVRKPATPGDAHSAPVGADGEKASALQWLTLIERCDGLRKPDRFIDLITAATCVLGVDLDAWRRRLVAVRSVDAGAVASTQHGNVEGIKAAIRQARLQALLDLSD